METGNFRELLDLNPGGWVRVSTFMACIAQQMHGMQGERVYGFAMATCCRDAHGLQCPRVIMSAAYGLLASNHLLALEYLIEVFKFK